MKAFSIATDIAAPAQRVWEVMSDTARWHEWTPSVTSIRRLDAGPLVLGSRALIRQPRLPPALWTVTAIEPGSDFTLVNTAPGVRVIARHWVEPTNTGCRATLSIEYQGALAGLLGKLTGGITRRYLALEAAGLQGRSENPAFRHPGAATYQ